MTALHKLVVRFFAVLIGLGVVLLILPWPAMEEGYGRLFAACGNRAITAAGGDAGLFGTTGAARLEPEYEADPQRDIRWMVLNFHPDRRGKEGWRSSGRFSSRHMGYIPTATLVALVLATPMRWRRRLRALLWGLLLIQLFVLFRLGVVVLTAFHGGALHCLFQLDRPWSDAFRQFSRVVAVVPATAYLVPLVVWVFVSFRRQDLAVWMGPGAAKRPDRAKRQDGARDRGGSRAPRKRRKRK